MSEPRPTSTDERTHAGVFIQWKGTDVCLDFTCTCGRGGHYDGFFAYGLRCDCGRIWEMPTTLTPLPGEDDGGAIQDTDLPHDPSRSVDLGAVRAVTHRIPRVPSTDNR